MSNKNMNIINNDNIESEISLLDLISVITKRWKLIFFSTLVAAIFIFVYLLYTKAVAPDAPFNLFPNIYCPKVVVRLQESSDNSGIGSLVGGSEDSVLSGLLLGGASRNSNASLAQALITGNTLLDQLSEEMNFIEKYKIERFPIATSRETAKNNFVLEFDEETELLTIGFEDTDPEFATKVVNRALELLEKRFRELTMDTVSSKRKFYEEQMIKQNEALESAQNKMIEFMRENGIVSMEAQIESQVKEVISLNSQLVTKEVQLKNLKKKLINTDPEIFRLEEELEVIKQLIRGKTFGFSDFTTPTEPIPQYSLPRIAAEYNKIEKEVKMNTELYISFRSQYESAKIDEANDTKQFQVIERAEIPEIKSKPSRAKICIIFTFAIAFLSVLVAFILEYTERVKADPVESEKLKEIKKNLRLRK